MDDFTPDPENITLESADLSYLKADGFTFQGEQLKAFSITRQFAAQALGNKILSGTAQRDGRGAYYGMFIDVAALIFLCQCPNSDVLLAVRRPEKVMEKVLDWAETVKLTFGSPSFEQACEIFGEVMASVIDSQFKVQEKEGTESKNA
jgi:hypothetical protein